MAIVGGNWTYSGDPRSSVKDQVRYMIGDTDQTDQLLSDEEIEWEISEQPNKYIAAAVCLESIVNQGRFIDKTVGDLSISASQREAQAIAAAGRLRGRSARSPSAKPYVGGVSVSAKQSQTDNSDNVRPSFTRGQFDNPGSAPSDDPNWWRGSGST